MLLPLACLIIGLLCALTSRILVTTAAFRISPWWGIGVFFPFGPLFFRLTYPDEAAKSRMFGLATLVCFFLYLTLGGIKPRSYHRKSLQGKQASKVQPMPYAIEKPTTATRVLIPAPTVRPTPTLDQRRAANAKQLEQLRVWGEQLRARKKNLSRNDTEGQRFYAIDLALYNDAMAKATAEQKALADTK